MLCTAYSIRCPGWSIANCKYLPLPYISARALMLCTEYSTCIVRCRGRSIAKCKYLMDTTEYWPTTTSVWNPRPPWSGLQTTNWVATHTSPSIISPSFTPHMWKRYIALYPSILFFLGVRWSHRSKLVEWRYWLLRMTIELGKNPSRKPLMKALLTILSAFNVANWMIPICWNIYVSASAAVSRITSEKLADIQCPIYLTPHCEIRTNIVHLDSTVSIVPKLKIKISAAFVIWCWLSVAWQSTYVHMTTCWIWLEQGHIRERFLSSSIWWRKPPITDHFLCALSYRCTGTGESFS